MADLLLVNDTSSNRHHGCQGVVAQLHALTAPQGLQITDSLKVNEDWLADPLLDQRIERVDAVIVNGEGTLHHNQAGARRIGRIAARCRQLNRPCVLLNSVYQANDASVVADVAQFTRCFVRESYSQHELAAAGIASTVVADLLLSVPAVRPNGPPPSDGPVLWFDSVDRRVRRALYEASRGARDPYLTLLAPPLPRRGGSGPRVPSRTGLMTFSMKRSLLPHVGRLLPPHWRSHYTLQRYAGAARSLPQLMRQIAGASLVVTGRFHAMVLCLVQETPFVVLRSNSHKCEGMLSDAGLSSRLIDDLDQLGDHPAARWQWSDAERQRFRRYKEAQRGAVERMMQEVARLASSTSAAAA